MDEHLDLLHRCQGMLESPALKLSAVFALKSMEEKVMNNFSCSSTR